MEECILVKNKTRWYYDWKLGYYYGFIKHPEVNYVGFLMLLYAGTTSKSNFNYYVSKNKVKKLKQWSKSAGNFILKNKGTSETLRNKTVIHFFNSRSVSIHVPKYIRPLNNEQFGHYLAGLIDGNGNFNEDQELIITFKKVDISLAYYVKKRIGYGSVKKVIGKDIILLIISKKEGLKKVILLINGKIRTNVKYDQIINNILYHKNFLDFKEEININTNQDKSFKNHWLTGLSDSFGNFYINPVNEFTDILCFQINWNEPKILELIKNFLGGIVIYNPSLNLYSYKSNNDVSSIEHVIEYFDQYHLLSKNYITFLKWRKSFLRLYGDNYNG